MVFKSIPFRHFLKGSNRTFMELKFEAHAQPLQPERCSNRTFMELKLRQDVFPC